MFATNDAGIRRALKQTLASAYDGVNTFVIEELGLRHGVARVDLAVIDTSIHGFELKSDSDTLRRLPRQIKVYNSVLDQITLVIGRRHYKQALQLVPDWWGIQLVKINDRQELVFQNIRDPRANPSIDIVAVAKLLWKSEALALLDGLGASQGIRSKPRAFVYARLAEVADPAWIRLQVRQQLRTRTDWRSAELQTSCDD